MNVRSALAILLLLSASCGGGSSDPVAPAPPPPPPPGGTIQPGPPASVAIQAGDNQTAAPATVVSAKPMVVVRDAQGRAAPGATVSFTTDVGSGAVEQSSVQSGGDGTASPGNWTLGLAEGDQKLRATVTGLTPAVFTAHALFPTIKMADTTVGPGTGVIGFTKAGDPMSGTSLILPFGSFPVPGHWTLEYRDPSTAPKRNGLSVVAPVIVVTTDQGMANQTLTLRIPVTVPAGMTATAFYYDPATDYLEPIPTLTSDATSLTVVTRHFSVRQMVTRPSGSSLRQLVSVAAPLNIQIVTFAQATAQLAQGPVSSDFQLGVDDWEFSNHGSYLTPNGQSVGQGISAVYYYLRVRDPVNLLSNLSGRFDRGPFWADNPLGYRVAALAEKDVNWGQTAGFLQGIEDFATRSAFNLDQAHFFSLAMALSATKKPQMVGLLGPAGWLALIAYQVSLTGILAVNPNDPGHSITIGFSNGKFLPVQMSLIVGGPAFTFSTIRLLGVSALVDMPKLDQRFQELAAGQVGAQDFPGYRFEYYDEDFGIWKTLGGNSLTVAWQDIQVRAICATCERNIAVTGQPAGLQAIDVYDGQAHQLASDQAEGSVKFRVPAGSSRIGLHALGGRSDNGGGATIWRHLDFAYFTINASKFYITPDPTNGLAGNPITFTARNQAANTPTPIQYVWSFDDGNAVTVNGDSVVSHAWNAAGVYHVTVRVKNATTALELGRATATVSIDLPVPMWRISSWHLTSSGGTLADGSHNVNQLIADGDIYDRLLGTPQRGLIIYQAGPVQVGPKTYGRGVYLQFYGGPTPPGPAGWDASAEVRVLAQPVAAPPRAPDIIEALNTDFLTDDGNLNAGSFGGRAINVTINAGTLGLKAMVYWEMTGVKNGTTLTGTVKRVQPMYEIQGFNGSLQNPNWVYTGDFVQQWSYTAVRLK